MKCSVILLFAISILYTNPVYPQDLIKEAEPEPLCSCDNPELVVDLGGSLKLDYKETSISTMDDGAVLLQDKISGNYFIAKNGTVTGPIASGDPRVAGFEDAGENSNNMDILLKKYKGFIIKAGDKYNIIFGGKTYGPFAEISSFTVSMSKDKFAALVVENVLANEMDGKAMDEAMKNAKTDQERMQLAMKYSQQMQQKMMQGGGPEAMTPKVVTNIPDATFNPLLGGTINGNMKYDNILVLAYDKVLDLQGNTVITLKQEHLGASDIFVSSDDSKYAYSQYGSLSFSDGSKSLTDLFNLHLVKTGGKVYLAYMYYSPKRNALMQCKIPF